MATRTLPPPPKSKKKPSKRTSKKSSAKATPTRTTKKKSTKKKTTKKKSTKKKTQKKKSATKKKTQKKTSRGKGKTLAPRGKLTSAGATISAIKTHKDESIEGEYLKRSTLTGEVKKVTAESRKAYQPKSGKVTDAQRRQLTILNKNPKISPAEFARKCWPDAEGWKSTCRTGVGRGREGEAKEVPGGAMVISAGAALGKLRLAGWAEYEKDGRKKLYSITADGKKAMKG